MPASRLASDGDNTVGTTHEQFMVFLPSIRGQAKAAARRLPVRMRSEFVLDVIAAAYVLYARLAARKLMALAYPTPLATYAIAHVRAGRSIGAHFNGRDVLSVHAQRLHRFVVVPLERAFDQYGRSWRETLLDKGVFSPCDAAAFRLDFEAWLNRLSARNRAVVDVLVGGESTSAAARQFRVSVARISQIRRELKRDWELFQSDRRARS